MSAYVIDFHSHMLPGIDDGSPDVDTSLAMLHTASQQGVQVQVLTPHYYPWREDIQSFVSRREESLRVLSGAMGSDLPSILVGAEAAFFHNMSRTDLSPLCIGSSRVILIELPFENWDRRVLDEIAALSLDKGYQVVLAHVERYLGFRNNYEMLGNLSELPIHMQVNAESFLRFTSRKKTLDLLRSGKAHILGSDAHNCSDRRPNLLEGRQYIAKRLGAGFLRNMDEVSSELLQKEFAVQ